MAELATLAPRLHMPLYALADGPVCSSGGGDVVHRGEQEVIPQRAEPGSSDANGGHNLLLKDNAEAQNTTHATHRSNNNNNDAG